ncbi:hypothetical protein [Candidatus Palauibacter sp.]|uniref:hypothetical protein n=1 Tax=Candidatus Palauibacter sp. TaxID=3101350 RepID=UPI003AF24242
MSGTDRQCPLCLRQCGGGGGEWGYWFDCETCGKFSVEQYFRASDATNGLTVMQRSWLSHFARTKWDLHELLPKRVSGTTRESTPAVIDRKLVGQARNGDLAVTRAQQAANAIRHIGDRVLDDGGAITLPYKSPRFAAVIGAPNSDSAWDLMAELAAADTVKWNQPAYSPDGGEPAATADLTLAGWEQYEEMKHGSHDGGYGFFAWQFGSPQTEPVFKDVLKPAFKEHGYPLRDMKDLSQPGLIDNIMQDRIRNASFVIVDLTDCNPGAYWEGGFAQALGKPVVYICHEEAFHDPATKPHFDTNHYTIVFWGADKSNEEFVEELIATLRRHPGGLDL